MDSRERKDVRPGLTVDIVLKQDQRTGRLTCGVVKDVLTKSPPTRTASRSGLRPARSAGLKRSFYSEGLRGRYFRVRGDNDIAVRLLRREGRTQNSARSPRGLPI